MFAAILDTCVLWPSLQRDVLLSFAVEGIYRPLWSDAILAELEYHEARKHARRGASPMDAATRAARLVSEMRRTFDDACVIGWEPMDGSFGLPDRDDEHVVAAAVVGGAGAIVTDNVSDMPTALIPAGIHVRTAAQFASDTVSVSPERALAAVAAVSARVRRPPMDVQQILDALVARYHWDDAVELLRDVA